MTQPVKPDSNPPEANSIAGAAVFGLLLVGVGSVVGSLVAAIGYQEWIGSALFAAAAAVAFGQLLSGLLRK